jgi:putative endonuclease
VGKSKLEKDPRTRVGRTGEDMAFDLLKKKGYKIVERNYQSPLGEIDIIAREGMTWVFVEVKTRLTAEFGSAKWAVGPRKQRKVSMVALDYLKRHSLLEQPARFDVVAVDLNGRQTKIELFRNAFDLAY